MSENKQKYKSLGRLTIKMDAKRWEGWPKMTKEERENDELFSSSSCLVLEFYKN